MKRLGILIAFVFVMGIFTAAYAENRAGSYTFTPFVGGYFFEGNHGYKEWPEYDYNDKAIFGLRAGYNFTENIGAEVFGHYLRGEVDAPYDNYFNRYGISVEGLYHFMPKSSFVPFIAAGVGGIHIGNTDREPGADEFVVHYGAGAKLFITEDIAFRVDVRHFIPMSSGERFNDLMATFGITFAFGGKKKVAEARAEEEPVPVQAEEVRPPAPAPVPPPPPPPPPPVIADSDKDGVPDNIDKCPGTTYGVPVDRNGCPLDSDKDGVYDSRDKCPGTPEGSTVNKDGCVLETVSIRLKVEFDSGKSVIKKQYHKEIEAVASFMKAHPDATATIVGHTDSTGNEKTNMALSKARAESVRQYLIKKFGIDGSRITALGYGSDKPIASNATKEGREKNRRIIAVIETVVAR